MRSKALWLSVVLAAASLSAWPRPPKRIIIERIIARVNNDIITEHQYEQEQEKLRAELGKQFSGAELEAQFREQSKNLLRDLIDQDLMVQKAKDLDINVDTDVIKRLDEIRKNLSLPTQQDLQNEVEKQGLVWEDFVDNIKRNLLMREVIGREVGRSIIISREDVQKFFDQHKDQFASPPGTHLAEILVSTEKRKTDEAEKRAKAALAELKAGQAWEEVVKKYSDGPSAEQGGDIGFMKEGTLAPDIAKAIAILDVGDTSDLIPTKLGFLILKVFERRSGGTPKFEEVEDQVREYLYNQKMQPALRQYLLNLRKESYFSVAPGYVDTGMNPSGELPSNKTGQ